jgi:hypothetical protein
VNKCHLVSLHKVQSLLTSHQAPFNVSHVYEFKIDEGKLILTYAGVQEKQKVMQDVEMISPDMQLRVGTRRERDNREFD